MLTDDRHLVYCLIETPVLVCAEGAALGHFGVSIIYISCNNDMGLGCWGEKYIKGFLVGISWKSQGALAYF
jgi:hypothetical protein